MFELSGVWVIEWFLSESISEALTGIQKQFELLKVRVIGDLSYRECTVWSFVHNLFQFGAMINRWMK